MTDSATDDAPDEGALAEPPDFDELFASVAEDGAGGRATERSATSQETADGRDAEPATAVFDRLKATERADADAVLADDGPSTIIESADEPDPPADGPAIGTETLVDEAALEELLLPDRTEGETFRWIETAEPTLDASDDETEPDAEESKSGDDALETATDDDGPRPNGVETTDSEGDERGDADTGGSGPTPRESAPLDLAAVESESAESTALVAPTESERATANDPDGGRLSAILNWVRSKLGRS